jgi:DNA-binding NtrC family response regulator
MVPAVTRYRQYSGTRADTREREGAELFTMRNGKSHYARVLVVDDEPLIRWSLAEALTRAGYQVVEAQDRKSTLEVIAEQVIDLVFLDLRLPDSDDLTLLHQLRLRSPDAAIILMTAHGTAEVCEQAERDGARCVVGKPFDIDHMVDLARRCLEAEEGCR